MKIPKQLQKDEFRFVTIKPGTKRPSGVEWQKTNNYKFTELPECDSYGIVCGFGNLTILDVDDKNKIDYFDNKINTFTVKTGSGGRHYYFICDEEFNKEYYKLDFGELRCNAGAQVLVAGSLHPSGNKYEIVNDIDIIEISKNDLLDLVGVEEQKSKSVDLSRSGIEWGAICRYIKKGLTTFEEIDRVMSAYNKWTTAPQTYREYQFKNALSEVRKAKEDNKRDKIIEKIEQQKFAKSLGKSIVFFTDKTNLAKQFLKIQPLWYDRNKIWWIWDFDNYYWKMIDDVDILNAVKRNSIANTVNTKDKNEILEALKQEARLSEPKQIKKSWIQFKDKIIDIATDKIYNAAPKYFVTNPIPWELGNTENTSNIDRIFEEWVGKEYVKMLYEVCAYCLLADYPIHRVFALIGNGLNGKSKFLELICKLVGNDNRCSTDLDRLINSRFESTKMFRKLVCLLAETDFNVLKKTALFKRLTGQDTTGFEIKNKNPFDDYNYAKILMATNTLPITYDKTIGFYRRWLIIDFPNTFTEEKDILKDIPDEEYNNLCKKSLHILKDLLIKGAFDNEGNIRFRSKRYEEKSNPIAVFIKKRCNIDSDLKMRTTDFQNAYNNYLKTTNTYRKLSRYEINKQLKYEGFDIGRENIRYSDNSILTTTSFVYGLDFKKEIEVQKQQTKLLNEEIEEERWE